MPLVYYLTSTEDSSMGMRGPCGICIKPCKTLCWIYRRGKLSVGLKGKQRRYRDKLSHPARMPDQTVRCYGTNEVVGEVKGGKGFTDACRLNKNKGAYKCYSSDDISCFLIHLLQQPDLLITESSLLQANSCYQPVTRGTKNSNTSNVDRPHSSGMPLSNTPRKH